VSEKRHTPETLIASSIREALDTTKPNSNRTTQERVTEYAQEKNQPRAQEQGRRVGKPNGGTPPNSTPPFVPLEEETSTHMPQWQPPGGELKDRMKNTTSLTLSSPHKSQTNWAFHSSQTTRPSP